MAFETLWFAREGWPGADDDYIAPGPHAIPGVSTGTVNRVPVNSVPAGTPTVPVREVNRYPDAIVLNFANVIDLGVGGQLVLTRSNNVRIALGIRALETNTTTLLIGFGFSPNAGNASFALPAGGMLYFDSVVFQNDVYLSRAVGALIAGAVVTYGTSDQ
jgi:hypothetical protein